MDMNSYTIEMHEKQGKPVFFLAIRCSLMHGVFAFNDMDSLKRKLEFEKDNLRMFGTELAFRKDFLSADSDEYAVIKTVCEDDDIVIHGTSGHTYSKTIFPTPQDYENYMYKLMNE